MHGPGRPMMMLNKMVKNDCREWKLTTLHPRKGTHGDQVRDLLSVQLANYQ